MIDIFPIPAFTDNYIWALFDENGNCVVVDPGDAAPVLAFLQRESLTLTAILITHHHGDHTGGIEALLRHAEVPVYGPAHEAIAPLTHRLNDGDLVHIDAPHLSARVLAVPGHTSDHIAYYLARQEPPLLFCGDTLFAGGCGRLFEGTAAQMLASLDRLAALPDNTRICCAHEYTLANLHFALSVSPTSATLAQRLIAVQDKRARGAPSLPSTLAIEKATNPFLRVDDPDIQRALVARGAAANRLACFAELRHWKDDFRG